MSLIIRLPLKEDYYPLEEIFFVARKKTFIPKAGEEFKLDDFSESIKGEELWVAEHNKLVVGFVSMYTSDSFIHNLFVHPDWHRVGIGSSLLAKAESRLYYPIELRVRLENWKACNFYQKNGWVQVYVNHHPAEQYYCYRKYS
jgi:ribosomal protein S18 acetylase RimI-like enzyme